MIGYHYTSLENYHRIRSEGLVPYQLRREIADCGYAKGIWVYVFPQQGLSHLACVAYQCLRKRVKDVVSLQVEYKESDRLTPDGLHTFTISHKLFDDWPTEVVYHSKEPATLLFRPVPPRRIRRLCTTRVDDVRAFVTELGRGT